MLLKRQGIPSPGLLPLVFFYLLNSIKMQKKYFSREKPIQVSWNDIGLKLIWSKWSQHVLRSLKRSPKFCYWILFRSYGHFFLQHLWNTDFIFGCCCMTVYLLKFPRQDQAPHSQNETVTYSFHPHNKISQKPWFYLFYVWGLGL